MNRTIARILSLILLITLVVSGSAYAQDSKEDSLTIHIVVAYNNTTQEGHPLSFTELKSDVPAYIVDGTTMIPLRSLAEGFGYVVNYQEKDKKIIIQDVSGENELVFTIGSTTVIQNGQTDTMLQAPIIRESRTFIPLRYVSEFFEKYVTWKKSIDGQKMFIWVSSMQLLTEDDIAVEEDDNYYSYMDPMEGWPMYYLKDDGQTNRGIKIGDSYEKVIESYGEPHEKEFKDGVLYWINYRSESLMGLVGGSVLTFSFENDIVNSVKVIDW